MADLKSGWEVARNDERRLGAIREVGQDYLLVSTPGLGRDLYIPSSAIANVENEVVYLNVAHADVTDMGWSRPPRAPVREPST